MKADGYHSKIKLEEIFRDTLKKADEEFKRKNFNELEDKEKVKRFSFKKSFFRLNKQLQEELKIQKEGVQDLLKKFNIYDENMKTSRLENSMLKDEIKEYKEHVLLFSHVLANKNEE